MASIGSRVDPWTEAAMLYLLKGSRVREYHQQNVSILGAAEGEHVNISYGQRWIQRGLAISTGDACILVYADSPYDTFVPVRFGIVNRIDRPDDRLDLNVRLGTFVRAGGGDPLTKRWARYDRNDPGRPGRIFAFEDENPGIVAPQSLDEQDEAWRHAVDGLATNGYFDRSTFARVRRITDARGAVITGEPVRLGQPLMVELETRTPTASLDDVGFFVDAEPEGGVTVDEEKRIPATGTATVAFTPSIDGELTLHLGLLPEPLLSSRPTIRVTVARSETASSSRPAQLSTAADQQLVTTETRMLIARLRREATMSDESWFGLYQDLFLRWDGNDPMIITGFASAAYDTGRFDDCAKALARLGDRRRPEDDFRYLLASLQAGATIELKPLLDRLDLNTERDFDDLLAAMDKVQPNVLEDLTVALTSNVLGEDKLLRFLDRVFPSLKSLTTALDVAEQAAYADPDRGADLLMRRWPNADTAPEPVVKLLVEWGARAAKLAPYLQRAMRIAEATSDWPEVESLAKQARQLVTASERGRLLAQAGEAMMLSGSPPVAEAGFGLLTEVVADAATQGDLDAAVRYAEALTGFAATRGEPEAIAAAAELNGRVTAALEESQALREWRAMQDDLRGQMLAQHLRGRVLHLVGGQIEPWWKDLELTVGFSEVRWHETAKHGSNKTDWANTLDADRDVVVVLWERIGHAITTPLKDKCARKNVRRIESRTSLHDVLAALEQLVDTAQD